MKTSKKSRLLSAMLAILMVVTMFPVTAFAATSETWTKVDLADIKETDTVTITMTDSSGNTYALYNGNGASKAPVAVVCSVSGNTMTAEQSSSDIGWNISNNSGTLIIYKAGTKDAWLYSTNTNNGTRVGSNNSNTWVIDSASGYLKHEGTGRYLGVYLTNPDWRCYTNTTGNTANQTLGFWKLDSSSGGGNEEPTVTKVATPTASVAPGEVQSGTKVAFSTETDGATIKYFNVKEKIWMDYTGPIEITEDIAFSVMAEKDGLEDSETATFAYTVASSEPEQPTEPEETKAVLVTDISNIASGDKIVIVAKNSAFALGTTQNGNNRAQAAVTKEGNEVVFGEYTQVITVEKGTQESTFAFNVGEGYLYAASSSKNYLRTETSLSDNSSWSIEIASDGTATIKAQGTNTRNWLRHNSASSIFACYASGQNDVLIYEIEVPYDPITEDMIENGVMDLRDANAKAAENVTVIGQVVYHYGKTYNGGESLNSIILEDLIDGEIYGFQVYDYNNYAKYKVGDIVKVTGNIADYNGVKQMSFPSMEVVKTGLEPIAAQEITVSELGADYLSEYVYIKDVTLGEYNGGGDTKVTDSTGTKNLYCGAPLPEGIGVSDITAIYACCSAYKTTYQLRNGTKADYVVKEGTLPEEPGEPDEPTGTEGTKAVLVTNISDIEIGDEVIFVCASKPAVMGPSAGNFYASVTEGFTLADNNATVYFDEETTQILVVGEGLTEGTYSFKADSNYIAAVTGGKNYLKNESKVSAFSSWTVEIAENGNATIKSTTTETDRIWIRYNPTSPRFSCYKSGQSDIAVYKVERPQYAKLNNDIANGDEFVIHYVKENLVMSDVADGKKLKGVAGVPENDFLLVEDGMSVLTASVDNNGYYTFTNGEGKYLTSGSTGNSLTFADAASDYSLWTIKEVTSGVHIVNVNAEYKGNKQALEIYQGLFTTYNEKDQDYYLFNLYTLTESVPPTGEGIKDGDEVVIYNLSAEGVLAAQNDNVDSPSINGVLAEVADGKAVPENGGVVFTVEVNGEYFRFKNETYGYLCSNGTGNNAFYSKEASEDADWKLTSGKKGGYNFESRTAKFNGKYSQFLEYYADSYKTYSMYGDDIDYDIYEFFFYPVAESVNVTEGIVNMPEALFGDKLKANLGLDFTTDFTFDAPFGVDKESIVLTAHANDPNASLIGDIDFTYDEATDSYTLTVPADYLTKTEDWIFVRLKASDSSSQHAYIYKEVSIQIIDEPVVENVSPAIGTETKDNKKPVISADIINAGEGAEVSMTINGETVEAVYENGKVTYTPSEDLPDGRTTVVISVKRVDGVTTEKSWSFTVGETTYQLYFGQLHSHTTYSDGSGSLDSALEYIKGLPESANVDFVAFTDHSNYFDSSDSANPEGALYDTSLATSQSQKLWKEYTGAMDTFNAEQQDVLALAGFEMTWSGGPGHINTFNTPGIVSRNNKTLNNKTNDAGMKAYYALLSQAEGADSISQFNHPGSTFGTFSDFAYWDALIDTRIQLVEVGNGEGQIGAGGYYPSYEYYTMALDKGWHVAPTNNQDNHKGKWGNANDARDVILADALTEEAIYEAIRAMRMYSTEDKNLEIGYTVNGLMLGSSIPTDEVPEKLDINVTVYDPDSSDSISKVEVIVNSGKVAYTWDDPAVLASGELSVSLNPSYSYYYIKVTEGDGDLAVTAPVWVGESLKLGISSVECGTSTPVTGEEVTITTTLFNSENKDANIKALTYTIGSQVIGTDNTGYVIDSSSTKAVEFKYTPDVAKLTKITVTAVVEQNGTEYTFTMDVELDVQNSENLVYIGIDASHYNEYVAGNYKDSMGNFSNLAAEYSVRTVTLETSSDLIAACSNEKYVALILTAPSRRLPAAQNALLTYTAEELAAIKAFNEAGGTVILAGWSDHYEYFPDVASVANMKPEEHMAATQNAVLEALGSSLRIGDDATYDNTYNGGANQPYRLYFNTYGESFLTDGVEVDPENPHDRLYTEVFSHYGGASIYTVDGTLPSNVSPVVFGHATTYSEDRDFDGLGGNNMPKYEYAEGDSRLMIMATEQLEGKGLIIVSGAAFMSNFEVQATIEDSGSEKNYSNYKICENLIEYLNPTVITDISEVNKQTETGYKYTIEGIVTSNASGFDKDTAFFDCIYVQDETGGICCFPVAGNYKIGDKVRITGTTEFYQGEPELQVSSIEVIGEGKIEPTEITAEELNNRSAEGKLVTISGVVESFELANGLVQTIMVKDEKGDVARIFIDGYITTDKDVENLSVGSEITVTGLASYDDTFNAPEGPFPRIRVRDRADVVAELNEDNLIDVVVPGADSDEIHKVLIEEKVEIPENLPEEYKEIYSTTEKIESELEKAIYLSSSKFNPNNTKIAFMELTLMRKTENGWVEVHQDDFPEEGIEICIPYPEGSGIFNDFKIAHLRDDGKIEILNYNKTFKGLVVKVYSLSPFAVAYRENIFNQGSSSGSGIGITDIIPGKGGNEFNPSTGAPVSPASAMAAIIVLSAAALAFGKRK